MKCPKEEILDSVAMRLWRAGIDPRIVAEVPERLADLKPVLDHAASCQYCKESLSILYETEASRRSGSTAAEEARALDWVGPVRVLPLCRASSDLGLAAGAIRSECEPEPYSVAADSADRTSLLADEGTAGLPLTLSTSAKDANADVYVVRVFSNQAGAGATAVLVETPPGERFKLRVSGSDYSFDERGYAALPLFPRDDISLLVFRGP